MGILGARKGHYCKSARHRNKHRSASFAHEDVTVMYNVQNSNDEDITFHTKLNEVRPITTVGTWRDSQSSDKFAHVKSSDQMNISADSELSGKNSSVEHGIVDTKEEEKLNLVNYSKNPKHDVNVTYWLWIGPDPATAEKHNMTLRIETNATFYAVMQKAASLNHKFT